MKSFAVLQLSGCAGCEVALLNAGEWIDQLAIAYMPLVASAYDVPEVDILLVSGDVRTDEDLYKLQRAAGRAGQLAAVGTCAISGGVANLGNRDEVHEIFLTHAQRRHVPRLLPKCRPIDAVVTVDRYLPGCPPTPELFMAMLLDSPDFHVGRTVCVECGRDKVKDTRPTHLVGFQQGRSNPTSAWSIKVICVSALRPAAAAARSVSVLVTLAWAVAARRMPLSKMNYSSGSVCNPDGAQPAVY